MNLSTQSAESVWPKPFYAWYVVAMLVLAYTFAILDRAVISLLVQPIKDDFGVTDAEIGLLQGLAFAICYTTFGLFMGAITDRASRRLVLILGITVWSLSTVLCGFAPNFRLLFLARIGVGLGEACILPVAGSIIADYFSPLRRPKAYGIFLLGGTFGTASGYGLGALAIVTADAVRAAMPDVLGGLHNWQVTFFLAGVPGLVVAVLILLTVREPARRERIAASGPAKLGPLIQHLRTNARAYFTLLLGTVLNVTGIYAQISWAATLFIRVHEWEAAKVGNTLAVLSVFGAMSSIIVGWTVSALAKRGHTDAPVMSSLMHSTAMMVAGPLVCLAPSPILALVPYIAFNLFANWSTASALMGLSQITPNELRGQATALYTLLTGLVSLTVGSYSVGFLTDNIFTDPKGIAPALATVFAVVGFLAILVLSTGRASFRAAAARAEAWQKG